MIPINSGWKINFFDMEDGNDLKIASADYNDSGWLNVSVPGDVHTGLIDAGYIKDPFYAHNDVDCRWISEKVWWYRGSFEYSKPVTKNTRAELIFEGLDTYAAVFLNGSELGSHNNMFVPASFDVTDKLKIGTNIIAVRFDPVSEDSKNRDFGGMWLTMNKDRVFSRKASTNFGWDWGPVITTVGIWKDVCLKIGNKNNITDIFVKTIKISKDCAEIKADIGANIQASALGKPVIADITIANREKSYTASTQIKDGRAVHIFKVPEPRLWWTHDIGTPELYSITVKLLSGETVLDSRKDSFGIRTIELKHEDDEGMKRFTFILNGVEIFARGANWIPADNMMGSIKDSRYMDLIEMAKTANMNMLRVWGGGIYEKDVFYNECDRQGILVWQDFMFSCSSYPDHDDGFMENVRKEAEHVVKRLRNHPSLAIWCGNNENQWLHAQRMYYLEDKYYHGDKIFSELIPGIVSELDDTRAYWPSSPFGGDDPNSDEEGDKHNWQVWAGSIYPHKCSEKQETDLSPEGTNFKLYVKDMGKFISEFGLHAAPVKETLRRNIPEKDLYLGSFELDYRNKDITPARGKMLLEAYTGQPKDLDQYIDYSMLCQAEGLKFGVEHYRRRKPECSGALIWQLNDCWPGTSWSLIDYYLFPKASYYYAKRFFAPILLSFKEEENDSISLWVTNDTLEEYSDTLTVGVENFFGNSFFKEELAVKIAPNTSSMIKIYSLSGPEIIMFQRRWNFMYVKSQKDCALKNEYFFVDHKDVFLPEPGLLSSIIERKDSLEVNISTNAFARFVKLECPIDGTVFSDNYFNILPGGSRKIIVSNTRGIKLVRNDISVGSLHN